MSGKVKIEIHNQALQQLTQSQIYSIANTIAQTAGEGFESEERSGRLRPVGIVRAATIEAKRRNAKENTLLKAVGNSHV